VLRGDGAADVFVDFEDVLLLGCALLLSAAALLSRLHSFDLLYACDSRAVRALQSRNWRLATNVD
jgi:hypothetical protein